MESGSRQLATDSSRFQYANYLRSEKPCLACVTHRSESLNNNLTAEWTQLTRNMPKLTDKVVFYACWSGFGSRHESSFSSCPRSYSPCCVWSLWWLGFMLMQCQNFAPIVTSGHGVELQIPRNRVLLVRKLTANATRCPSAD